MVECRRCGAMMDEGGVCPVCETPYAVALATQVSSDDPGPTSRVARWWQSGQLAVALAAGCFLGALPLPLMSNIHVREGSSVTFDTTVRPWHLVMGTLPAFRGRMSAWLLPGAALFLLSLLRSRRTRDAMVATRPVLGVVALAPLVSTVLPILKLRRVGLSPTPGAALIVVLCGVVFCVLAATRFGNGIADEAPKRRVRAVSDDE